MEKPKQFARVWVKPKPIFFTIPIYQDLTPEELKDYIKNVAEERYADHFKNGEPPPDPDEVNFVLSDKNVWEGMK